MSAEVLTFSPDIPPDLEHARQIREEALDWLEASYQGRRSFTTGDVLRMAGEEGRRWLIGRLRKHDIGVEAEFSLPDAADALAVLFLRSRGVKFREAIDAVRGGADAFRRSDPRYGGVWNRLIVVALERLNGTLPTRLLGAAVSAILPNPGDEANCLVIVRSSETATSEEVVDSAAVHIDHDDVYRAILERPAPACAVISPSRELLFLDEQLPARSEVTSRSFIALRIATHLRAYELIIGTLRPVQPGLDQATTEFVGRILDLVLVRFDEFLQMQSASRLETTTAPESGSADDLQLWLVTQFLQSVYVESLCEIIETSRSSPVARVLASSAATPWEPSPWGPPMSLEMLSGYAGRVGVPLVVEALGEPWTLVMDTVESELRYLRSRSSGGEAPSEVSAVALPVSLSTGDTVGALYVLMPRPVDPPLEVEVRVLSVFSRIVGEILELRRATTYFAAAGSDAVLRGSRFEAAMLDLLSRRALELGPDEHPEDDLRLPFLLLSAHRPEPDEFDPAISGPLQRWLVETLRYLDWRSFVRSHLSEAHAGDAEEGFIGELPGIGMMIALDRLVTKDDLDRIRNAFPTAINRLSPPNAPVRLLAWVLDVPAQRLLDAAASDGLTELASDIQRWAFDVTSALADVAESSFLAHQGGEWDAALRRVRRALQTEGGRHNAYLHRLGAECAFSLGDWPSALEYARDAVQIGRRELGSGVVRSLCLEADARIMLCDPEQAWNRYTEAASQSPRHPLPRYYRGQASLLIARLLDVWGEEQRAGGSESEDGARERLTEVRSTLVTAAMADLTAAADLLDRWGLIPETYQYRNFHLVPTLLGQGAAYLLSRAPGPAASRLQSARRAFPRDDLFFREYIFAKAWEQGIHQRYAALLLGTEWDELSRQIEAHVRPPG